jgi:hypothetical protein
MQSVKLWLWTPSWRGVLNTILCDKVGQWLASGWWFSPVSSTNKIDHHDITEILLKVALNTITVTPFFIPKWLRQAQNYITPIKALFIYLNLCPSVKLESLSCSSTKHPYPFLLRRPSWPWSYGSWIYNYLCNQCLSSLALWVLILLRWGILDTTLCDQVCHWLETGQWFFPGTPVSSTN